MIHRKKIYLIVNPVSGTSRNAKNKLPEITSRFLDHSEYDVHFMFTAYAGHAHEIAKQAVSENVYCVVAVGGDGTVNEVARALVNTEVILGIIPLGSGNGLARDLQISTNPQKAMKVIAENNVLRMDYGIANDHIFFCTCGVGFDAIVASNINGRKHRGIFMYMKEMTDTFFKQKPQTYEIVYPGGHIKNQMFLVTCANAGQYGYNAYIAPHADIQDGQFDVTLLEPINLLNVPMIGAQMFAKNLDENKKITTIRTSELTIIREKEGPMHLDGDAFQSEREINIRLVPKGLKVLVPKDPPPLDRTDPADVFVAVMRSIAPYSPTGHKKLKDQGQTEAE